MQTSKRGFATKREALEWERKQMRRATGSLDMTFADFVDVYEEDMKNRLKLNTWQTKKHIIDTKLIPFFGDRRIDEIGAKDVIAWQNELMKYRDQNGNPYEMDRGSIAAGVKRIRVHDLRHSYVSLLIEMGFSAVAIADRVGHESIDITYRYAHLFPFRQTEITDLDRRVKLSGLTKQKYFLRRITGRDVVVQGSSPRVYKALRNQMVKILDDLRRLNRLAAPTMNSLPFSAL
jgi:hypothetical protein